MNFTTQQQILVENTNLICKTLFQEITLPYGYGATLNGRYMNEGFGFDFFSDSFFEKEITTSSLEIDINRFSADREKRISVLICLNGLEVTGIGLNNIRLQNDVNAFLLSSDNLAIPKSFNELSLTRIGLDSNEIKFLFEKCISDLGLAKHKSVSKKNQSAVNEGAEEKHSNYIDKLNELRKLLD